MARDTYEKRVITYHVLGKTYGWSPREIDEVEYDIIMGLLELIDEDARRLRTIMK